MISAFLLLTLLVQAAPADAPPRAYVPERVYDTRRGAFSDFEVMLGDLASAEVVFVGEQHDDPNTHLLEYAMVAGLQRRGVPVTISLEMFERDVQGALDKYLAGTTTEAEFLKESRPWPRYATDYRALVEHARAHGWPVVAANVPRRYAAEVAKGGKAALDALPPPDRAMAAADLDCPRDAYYERFVTAMGGHAEGAKAAHPGGPPGTPRDADDKTERYYWSQCVKDETMAESIARAVERRPAKGPVVHVTGAFHSEYGAGAVERTRRRLGGRRIATVTVIPVTNIDEIAPSADDLKRADYLVYTVKQER